MSPLFRKPLLCIAAVLWSLCAHAVEVNTANEAELDSVRGLGPASTGRILKAREAGPFADWQDLMRRVKGIKHATAQKLSSQGLTVGGLAFDNPPAKTTQ